MQETRGRSPIQEYLTCRRVRRPMCPSYWECALEPGSYNYWSPYTLNPTLHNKRSPCNEKTAHHTWRVAHARCNQRIQNNRDPAQPEINKYYLKITFKLFFEQCSYVFTKAHLLSFCYMSSILLHFCFLSQKIGNFIKILIWILI